MKNNYFISGDWNIICDVCGWKIKASDTKHRWDGRITCKKCWEPRHDSDFIKARRVDGSGGSGSVPWTQPDPPEISVSPYDTYIVSGANGADGVGNAVASGFQGNVSVVANGDHPAGDGLTTLQTVFAGGVSTDISPSARGAGTNTDAVQVRVGINQLEIDLGGGFNRSLSWSGAALGRQPNTGYTAEYFVRFIETVANPGSSASQLAQVTAWNLPVSRLGMNGFSGGINPYIAESTAAYGYTSTDDIFVKFSPFIHVAHVCNSTTNGDLRVYIDGQRVINHAPGSLQLTAPYTGTIVLGGVCTSSLRVQFSGVRVRHAEMYTGASFPPPASPTIWGPP